MPKNTITLAVVVVIVTVMNVGIWSVNTGSSSTGDRVAIQNLMMGYEWAVDNAWEPGADGRFGSLFAEDALYSLPIWGVKLEGREEIMAMFRDRIKPAQDEPFSHIGGVLIDISGNTATGRDSFYHAGYNAAKCSTNPQHPNYQANNPRCSPRLPSDLEVTMGWHKYEFKKINSAWKITKMTGLPRHNSAVFH